MRGNIGTGVSPIGMRVIRNDNHDVLCGPGHGEKNELIGILSVDLTNRWLRDLVDSIKPYKGSYTVVIDKQGRYILRREGEVMIGQNMFETAKEARDTNVTILVNEMAAGKSGSIIVDDGGVLSYVYYTPVVATDWYMAVNLSIQIRYLVS